MNQQTAILPTYIHTHSSSVEVERIVSLTALSLHSVCGGQEALDDGGGVLLLHELWRVGGVVMLYTERKGQPSAHCMTVSQRVADTAHSTSSLSRLHHKYRSS